MSTDHNLNILTLAFFFRRRPNPAEFTVHVGNIHVDEGYPYAVEKIILHPKYHPDHHYNDLAMLTINQEILTPFIAHICLPSQNLSNTELTGKETTLLGWGDTTFGKYL